MALDREAYQTRRQKLSAKQQQTGAVDGSAGEGRAGRPAKSKPVRGRYERRRPTATGALSPIRATLAADFEARAMF